MSQENVDSRDRVRDRRPAGPRQLGGPCRDVGRLEASLRSSCSGQGSRRSSALRPFSKSRGFEGASLEPEGAEGPPQGQVVLLSEDATVPKPNAVVGVAFELHPAAAALGPKRRAGQDAVVADLDHL